MNNKYPLMPIGFSLIGIYFIAILYVENNVDSYQFWTIAKYTYWYSWSISFCIYFLHHLNRESDDAIKNIIWCAATSLLIAIPVFLILLSLAIWRLYPDMFIFFLVLLVLGIGKLFGLKLLAASAFSSNIASKSAERKYKPNNCELQRFNGTQWITIGQGPQSFLFSRIEREKQSDIENGNYKTRYRVVDSDGKVQ